MSTEGTDPQKLLRKLSAVASFLDSGETTSRLFHVRRPIRSKYLDTKRFSPAENFWPIGHMRELKALGDRFDSSAHLA